MNLDIKLILENVNRKLGKFCFCLCGLNLKACFHHSCLFPKQFWFTFRINQYFLEKTFKSFFLINYYKTKTRFVKISKGFEATTFSFSLKQIS